MFIYLVTRNPGKLFAAKHIFDVYDIEIKSVEKDYPEIQGDTSLEIARFTARQAAKELNHPTIREDHSLFLNAIEFPGPYTSYFEKRIFPSELLKMLDEFNDREGFFEIATVYAEPNGFTQEYTYQVPFELAGEERGTLQSGWARLIMLKGETRTLAEYPEPERIKIWDRNYEDIAKYLQAKKM